MNAPQLKIEMTNAQIAIKKIKGSFKVNFHRPELEINYNHNRPYQVSGDMKIKARPAEVKIDLTRAREDLGLRDANSSARFWRKRSLMKVLVGIKEIAEEGEFLASIEKKGNRIAILAKGESEENQSQVVLKAMSEPEIEVSSPRLQINYEMTRITVKSNFQYPEVDFKPDKLDIYLTQKANLEIEVVDNNFQFMV